MTCHDRSGSDVVTNDRAIKWDLRFIDLAHFVSTWSKDPSTQTGAALVAKDKRIISTGYNGFPQCMRDDEHLYASREEKYSRIVHCEINALIFAREPVHDCTLFTWPFLSCDRCVVVMLQAGVRRFVAPRPNDDQLSRWGTAFARTKQYIEEVAGASWLEIEA